MKDNSLYGAKNISKTLLTLFLCRFHDRRPCAHQCCGQEDEEVFTLNFTDIRNALVPEPSTLSTFEIFYNSTFPGKSWQDPASIDIQWVATIVCQYWQDAAMVCQEITNYRKTRLFLMCNHMRKNTNFEGKHLND